MEVKFKTIDASAAEEAEEASGDTKMLACSVELMHAEELSHQEL